MTDSPNDHISDPARSEDSAAKDSPVNDPAAKDSPVNDPAANDAVVDATPTAPIHSEFDSPAPAPEATQPLASATTSAPEQPNISGSAPISPDRTFAADPARDGSSAFVKRSNKAPVVVAIVVAALIGGVSGAGVTAVALSSQSSSAPTTAAAPQNVTVNDTSKVNVITAVAAKAEPSVVTIAVTGSSEAGTGSGIILSADGYVLTNTHVVTLDGGTSTGKIQVTSSNGRLYDATVVGTDPIVDLAVIKLKNASGLQPAEFSDSSKLNVGETAIAIGAPLGLSNTVTSGIVSSLNRSITIASSAVPNSSSGGTSENGQTSPYDFWNFNNGQGGSPQPTTPTASATISLPVIQTDAAINPGNSGGALLDSDGKVIGVNVAIASAGSSSTSSGQSGSIGVGFAVPSNLAQRVSSEIIKNGAATHGLLGASVADVAATDSSSTVGATVQAVSSGGAADKAGLTKGDVITSFSGIPVTGSTDLTAQVRYLAAGASSTLTYVKGGKTYTADVTLGTLK